MYEIVFCFLAGAVSVAVSPAGGAGGYVGPWCEAWASFLGEGIEPGVVLQPLGLRI